MKANQKKSGIGIHWCTSSIDADGNCESLQCLLCVCLLLNLIHHTPLGSVPVHQRNFIGVVHIFRIVGSENIQKVTSCPLNFLSVSTICFAVRYPFLPAKDLLENLKPGLTKAKTTLGGPLIVAHQAKVMFSLFPAQFGVRAFR